MDFFYVSVGEELVGYACYEAGCERVQKLEDFPVTVFKAGGRETAIVPDNMLTLIRHAEQNMK